MPANFWNQGQTIAIVHGTDASLAERRVAQTAARSIRERGIETSVFAASDSIGAAGLTLLIGTAAGYPEVEALFQKRDRLRPSSPLNDGPGLSRGMTLTRDGVATAAVLGEDVEGLWLGVGRFLRHLRWYDGEFACPAWSDEFRPAMKLRGEIISSHDVSNTYMAWTVEQWVRYIEDMALWGMNLFITIPVHFADWKGMDPWADPPVFASDAQREKFERHWEIQSKVSMTVRDMGLLYGVWTPANDPAMAHHRPEWDRGWKEYICPSISEAREAILHSRNAYLSRLPHLDILFVPSADDGGCWCDDCRPWSATYLGLVREQCEIARKYHPDARVMLSNQALTHEENAVLCRELREMDDTAWIAGVAFAPGSNELFRHARLTEEWRWPEQPGFGDEVISVQWLRRNLPPEVDLYLYPDTTHSLRAQYPVWEIEPIVGHAYHRDPIFFRPAYYHRIYQLTAPFSDGSFPYSEGMYDNLNQVVWLELNCDPHRDPHEIVSDYWRWYVGEMAAPYAAAATEALEQAWTEDFSQSAEIDRALKNSFEVTQHLPRGRQTGNWRVDILRLRALTDQWLRERLDRAASVEKRVADRLREKDGSTRRALLQAVEIVRGALDEMGTEPNDAEIPELAARVLAEGLTVPAIARIGGIAGNLRWIARTLDDGAASGDASVMTTARMDVLEYERGVVYVDCGHPRRDHHRLNGRTFITLDVAPPDARPSQFWFAMSYGDDEPLSYRFTGLDPDREYSIHFTYFIPKYLLTWCYSGEQKLEASGIEIHGPLKLSAETPQRMSYPLPKDAYRAGETVLRFIPTGASQAAMVSEIWIRER